ncbi:Dihydrokaempferol 4-reductase protein [Dioscorea alata]|uniref:Dihydrokaempferol 4-reductase protein n=1 Tax=Dioscorea alata TaxID=55571 RepID=A0ACB7VE83_DIOAL|nr:Dihydrokaempferol 4-reductase protein [Dioscorea alata]
MASFHHGDAMAMCVTGATGYIGSWLVQSLLKKGYLVHATARDLDKARQVLSNLGGNGKLKIFKADLDEEGSFDEAVKGCIGVFHVAASMEFNCDANQNIESSILAPALRGTTNLLQSCSKVGSVKRVIFTSSISTITAKDENGEWIHKIDESCLNPANLVWKKRPSGWVNSLATNLFSL